MKDGQPEKFPEGTDIPLGLGMAMSQNINALTCFGKLSPAEQSKIISYVQISTTGEEAKFRIAHAVKMLGENNANFV